MIHTESEALQKWCPFARFSGANRVGIGFEERTVGTCIGTGCMLWQQQRDGYSYSPFVPKDEEGWELYKPERLADPQKPHLAPVGALYRKKTSEPTGYCGLARIV